MAVAQHGSIPTNKHVPVHIWSIYLKPVKGKAKHQNGFQNQFIYLLSLSLSHLFQSPTNKTHSEIGRQNSNINSTKYIIHKNIFHSSTCICRAKHHNGFENE